MSSDPSDFAAFGKAQTEALLNLQRELLDGYAQASRAWLDRAKSEIALWSGFAAKLTTIRSAPEVMEAYQKCVAEQVRMTVADEKRLFDDCRKITQSIAGSLNGGRWPIGST
jgi:hypothetical protein